MLAKNKQLIVVDYGLLKRTKFPMGFGPFSNDFVYSKIYI